MMRILFAYLPYRRCQNLEAQLRLRLTENIDDPATLDQFMPLLDYYLNGAGGSLVAVVNTAFDIDILKLLRDFHTTRDNLLDVSRLRFTAPAPAPATESVLPCSQNRQPQPSPGAVSARRFGVCAEQTWPAVAERLRDHDGGSFLKFDSHAIRRTLRQVMCCALARYRS